MMMVMMMTSAMAMMATDAKSAQYAATELFDRIDRTSLIDPSDPSGEVLSSVAGKIEIRDVVFAYPTSLDQPVCRGYSLQVDAGMVCALCGPSGSGKSTIVALLQRFYDPQAGSVLLDGVDIRSLNLKWLRQQIGLVGQEPVLFEGTVSDNIAYGKAGASRDEIEEAARLANAHTFILSDLGDGYQTQVGLRGGKLSGGQKQRVAIARALVRKPAIMLLDEATSALDNESEKVVQAALDELMTKQKRTTITIAHRLSTIRNADKIAVVNRGKVVEQGTHDDLLQNPSGLYYQLVAAQQ
jgi:ATP-binding cassette subfamily B (MDR/TAP) protein 1